MVSLNYSAGFTATVLRNESFMHPLPRDRLTQLSRPPERDGAVGPTFRPPCPRQSVSAERHRREEKPCRFPEGSSTPSPSGGQALHQRRTCVLALVGSWQEHRAGCCENQEKIRTDASASTCARQLGGSLENSQGRLKRPGPPRGRRSERSSSEHTPHEGGGPSPGACCYKLTRACPPDS